MALRIIAALLLLFATTFATATAQSSSADVANTTATNGKFTPSQDLSAQPSGGSGLLRIRKPLMRFRQAQLQYTLDGYARTHRSLVSYDGSKYYVAGFADDPGLYLVVPAITRFLNVSVDSASTIFIFGMIFLGFVMGAVGLVRYTGKRLAILPLLALLAMMIRFGDLYVFTALPILALIPWFLLYQGNQKALTVLISIAGVLIGISHLLRSFAGVSVLFFMVWVLVSRKRFVLVAVLCLSSAIPLLSFRLMKSNVDTYLRSQQAAVVYPAGHPFFHQIYIGLSFIGNTYVPGAYEDTIGIRRASEIQPGIVQYSPEYESVLRQELIRLFRTDPLTLGSIEFVKLCVIFTFVVVFANRALLRRSEFTYPFLLVIAFESLFGILTVPHPKYLLGMLTWCLLYSVVGVYVKHRDVRRLDVTRPLESRQEEEPEPELALTR